MGDIDKIELAEHEFNILLYMKHDKGFCAKMCSCLKRDYFESSLMGSVFHVVKMFFQKFNEFPSITTLSGSLQKIGCEPEKYIPVVESLDNEKAFAEISSSDRRFIETTVVEFSKRAKMKKAIVDSYDLLADNKFGEINELIQDALKFNIDVDLGIDLFDIDTRYHRLAESIKDRIPTGFDNFNSLLDGGWTRKEIYCVLGPPGMGKSIFLPNFGVAALMHGYNVVHYSFEMSEERVGLRYDGPISKIDLSQLVSQIDAVKKSYDRLMPFCKGARLKIKEFPTGAASIFDIEAHLEQLRTFENFIPDVIIVDYGDIMQSTHKSSNAYEEQGWVFRELRGLAIKYDTVVLTATQARRDAVADGGGTKAEVGMNQVADSMEKVRILDGLFSIVQSINEKTQGIIKLYIAKNRNGPSGNTVTFEINYDKMLLTSKGSTVKNQEKTTTDQQILEDADIEDAVGGSVKKSSNKTPEYFKRKFGLAPMPEEDE